MRAGQKGSEAATLPFRRVAGRDGLKRSGKKGSETAAVPFWRAAGCGGLMRAGQKGSEAAAPPVLCHLSLYQGPSTVYGLAIGELASRVNSAERRLKERLQALQSRLALWP